MDDAGESSHRGGFPGSVGGVEDLVSRYAGWRRKPARKLAALASGTMARERPRGFCESCDRQGFQIAALRCWPNSPRQNGTGISANHSANVALITRTPSSSCLQAPLPKRNQTSWMRGWRATRRQPSTGFLPFLRMKLSAPPRLDFSKPGHLSIRPPPLLGLNPFPTALSARPPEMCGGRRRFEILPI